MLINQFFELAKHFPFYYTLVYSLSPPPIFLRGKLLISPERLRIDNVNKIALEKF